MGLAQWQIFQRLGLAGPQGRPSSKVENSATVQAPLLGHFVAAEVVASDCKPVMLNLLACAWKFRGAARTQQRLLSSLSACWLAGCLFGWQLAYAGVGTESTGLPAMKD